MNSRPVIVALSGASGGIYGLRLLEALRDLGRPAWLVMSRAAEQVLALEHGVRPEQVKALAERWFDPEDTAAPIASGSCLTAGMAVVPCSVKTLSTVANSLTLNLVSRAADVHLKENRRLVLAVRETPLHAGHLELMLKAARLGATILPPLPAFYHHPETIDDLIDHSVGKILDQLDIEHDLFDRWSGSVPVRT